MFKNKKVLRTGVLSLAAVVLLATGGYAAGKIYKRKVTATFGSINFKYEGKDITKDIENLYNTPGFVMESRSYVPVRAIGDVLGVDVDYDVVTKTAKISDPKKAELDKKAGKIKELEDENAKLKKEIEDLKKDDSSTGNTDKPIKGDLKSLERYLNNTYGTYDGIDFNYELTESKDSLDVKVTVDLANGKQYYNWNRMGSTKKVQIIEDITNIIDKDFPNLDIDGQIYDKGDKKKLAVFKKRVGSKVRVSLDSDGGDFPVIDSLVSSEVEREFELLGIYDARLTKLYRSGSKVYFEVDFPDSYRREWNHLSDQRVNDALNYISRSISRDYENYYMDIDGSVYSRNGSRAGDYFKYYNSDYGNLSKYKLD